MCKNLYVHDLMGPQTGVDILNMFYSAQGIQHILSI